MISIEVALTDDTSTPTGRSSVNGTAGTTAPTADDRIFPVAGGTSGPAAPLRPIRLHVAWLDANPPHFLERWLCSWKYRYRRALGDRRHVALRRALACARSHGGPA